MIKLSGSILFPSALLLVMLSGCATVPTGPTVAVFPSPGKPFEQFQADDAVCRQWAAQQIGATPQETVNQSTATGAVAGTVIGGGLGAAIGSAAGHVEQARLSVLEPDFFLEHWQAPRGDITTKGVCSGGMI